MLGTPALLSSAQGSLLSQVEYAQARRPLLAIVELGFAEAMEAAASGTLKCLPSVERFRDHYTQVVSALRDSGARVVVTTVPDPIDTAYCHTIDAAARVLHMPGAELRARLRPSWRRPHSRQWTHGNRCPDHGEARGRAAAKRDPPC